MFKCIPSSEGNVWKYIFEKEDAIAEAVLYKYGSFIERTVICCSVQSGCSVGCTFCGTGKNFIRNLTSEEIVEQITTILKDKDIENINSSGKRFQIMFMSMGEPMLNWDNVERAIMTLHRMYPNAELLISTMGIDDDITFGRIIELSEHIDKIGLQFSIHKSNDLERNDLIPFKKKMRLSKIRDAGLVWWHRTGRKPYLNYCVDGTNNDYGDHVLLETLFSPAVFNFTFSVVCSADETMKEAGFRKHEAIQDFMRYFNERGYNTRMFDPAGQDDIGGGCGQLWYVQDWMRDYKKGDK